MMVKEPDSKMLKDRPSFYTLNTTKLIKDKLIRFSGPVPPEDLNILSPANGLNIFRHSLLQHNALVSLAGEPDGLVFTACRNNDLVSYVTFQKSDFMWWKRNTFTELIELGSMETDHYWRQNGLTTFFLNALFKNTGFLYFEKMVVITVQTVSNWDLCGTGLTSWEYRHLMIRFFSRFGFILCKTCDPEITDNPCNFLMARIGKNTPKKIKEKFYSCCEGLS